MHVWKESANESDLGNVYFQCLHQHCCGASDVWGCEGDPVDYFGSLTQNALLVTEKFCLARGTVVWGA